MLRLAAFLNGLIKQKRFSFEENRLCRNGDDAAEIAEKILKHLKYDKNDRTGTNIDRKAAIKRTVIESGLFETKGYKIFHQ